MRLRATTLCMLLAAVGGCGLLAPLDNVRTEAKEVASAKPDASSTIPSTPPETPVEPPPVEVQVPAASLDAGSSSSPPPGMEAGVPEPQLILTQSASEVAVRLEEQFEFAFTLDKLWQPARWIDLSSDPNLTLAVLTADDRKTGTFVAPVGMLYEEFWSTLSEARSPSIDAQQPTPDRVVVETQFLWLRAQELETTVQVRYEFSLEPVVEVFVTVTPNQEVQVDSLEYGWVNLSPELQWEIAENADSTQYVARKTTGPEPRSALQVTAETPADDVRVITDSPVRRHFYEGREAIHGPDNPVTTHWSMRLSDIVE